MKQLKARTKLYKKFSHLKVRITEDVAAITVNGRLVDMGRVCQGGGKNFRLAFSSKQQLDYFLKRQGKGALEYYGTTKDDMYFVHGWHQYTQKGSAIQTIRKYRRSDARLAGDMMKDNCFTGKHRSGDVRGITAAIKIDSKNKESQ